jgi:DNA-binding transcriptional MerR regulator
MQESNLFDRTASQVAAESGRTQETVRAYADRNLLECIRLANGTRLFRPDAAERVREIYKQRMRRWRGRPTVTDAA